MLKHGHARDHNGESPTYNSWQAMRERCRRREHQAFHRYGGSGKTGGGR
jgi:hypothetical protein